MDNSTLFDELRVELDIKPVNDPPLMEIIGDNEVYMNNVNYPTQISIPVESVDIEEGRNSLDFQNVVEINESYCDKVMAVQDEITNRLTAVDFDGNEVDCSNRFNCRVFCTPNLSQWYNDNNIGEFTGEPLEHMCDFADFNNDNIINQDDVFDCQNAVVEESVGFQSVELSHTPHWINTLNTYEGQTWEEHLNYAEQFTPDIYHQYWGNLTPKRYVKIIPNYNESGQGKFRVKRYRLGFN